MRNGKKSGESRGRPSGSSSQTADPSGSSSQSEGRPGIVGDVATRWYRNARNNKVRDPAPNQAAALEKRGCFGGFKKNKKNRDKVRSHPPFPSPPGLPLKGKSATKDQRGLTGNRPRRKHTGLRTRKTPARTRSILLPRRGIESTPRFSSLRTGPWKASFRPRRRRVTLLVRIPSLCFAPSSREPTSSGVPCLRRVWACLPRLPLIQMPRRVSRKTFPIVSG